MCLGFGEMKQTEQTSKTNTLPAYLDNAAQSNIANAGNITSTPFQDYNAPRVAPLSADQNTQGDMLRTAAGSGNPYQSTIEDLFNRYSSAPAGNVSAPSILGANVDPRTANIQDYINPYVSAALQPTLQAIGRQGDAARKTIGANATMSGAFGDARHGVEEANQMRDENTLVGNTVGSAYNNAFNTAAGLRGQDIANLIGIQNQNNQNQETALQRGVTGGAAFQGLDQYDTGRGVDLANQLGNFGATERSADQANKDAQYQEFMRKLGYNPQMLQLMSQVLASSPANKEGTQFGTTSKPDNSGYGLLGSGLGAALAFI